MEKDRILLKNELISDSLWSEISAKFFRNLP